MDMPIDCLSALPDSLLIYILTFLNLREAAITAVLSRRWRFLWTDLPKLELWDCNRRTKKIRDFVVSVHRTLLTRGSDYLEKFEVSFWYNKCFASDVDVWIRFCIKNKVQNVALRLNSLEDSHMLPQMMYSNSSLTCLRVRRCIMAPRRTIEWESLITLELVQVELSQHVFENILSGCPVLYELILVACWGLDRLEVESRSLHALAIIGWNDDTESLLEISAPHIHHLEIHVWEEEIKLRFTNISSLVSIKIEDIGFCCNDSYVKVTSYTKELFENLQHVKKLELGCWFTKVLSELVMSGWRLPQSRREYLIINAFEDNQVLPVIVELLESSPNLETLVINGLQITNVGPLTCSRPISYLKSSDLNGDLLHLKTVNIRNFVDLSLCGEPMLPLAQILLKRAVVLEKMLIDVRDFSASPTYASSDYDNIAQTLLSYPRSSQEASVLFHC